MPAPVSCARPADARTCRPAGGPSPAWLDGRRGDVWLYVIIGVVILAGAIAYGVEPRPPAAVDTRTLDREAPAGAAAARRGPRPPPGGRGDRHRSRPPSDRRRREVETAAAGAPTAPSRPPSPSSSARSRRAAGSPACAPGSPAPTAPSARGCSPCFARQARRGGLGGGRGHPHRRRPRRRGDDGARRVAAHPGQGRRHDRRGHRARVAARGPARASSSPTWTAASPRAASATGPAVVLVVGVNGTGKTTTVGKLARVLVAEDRDVLLGAADTFRAAAADQLETWGARVGVADGALRQGRRRPRRRRLRRRQGRASRRRSTSSSSTRPAACTTRSA